MIIYTYLPYNQRKEPLRCNANALVGRRSCIMNHNSVGRRDIVPMDTNNNRRMRNNNNNNNNIRNGAKMKKKRNNNRSTLDMLSAAKIPKSPERMSPYPAEVISRCTYISAVELFSGVNAYAVKEFAINNIRVVDPSLTDSAYGYSFYSQIYRIFRVTHCEVKFTVANNDGVPISCAFIANDTQPSTLVTSYDAARRLSGSGFTTGPSLVGVDTGNSLSAPVRYKVDIGNVVGNPLNYYAGNAYAGSDAASPTQTVWGAFIAYCYDAVTAIPDGLAVQAEFVLTTKFYSLRPI